MMPVDGGDKDVSRFQKVAVVVLNWNDIKDTCECIDSIRNLDYPNFETVVVDNASTDGSQQVIRERFQEVTLIENSTNLGFSGGFNKGIKAAIDRGAAYILCLNNDTILDRMFLRELMEVADGECDVGALCPMEYDYSQKNKIMYAGGSIGFIRSKNRGLGEVDKGQYGQVEETMMLCGAAMVLKSEAAVKTGGFDIDYFFDWEDKDLAIRLSRGGFRLLFVPRAKLWHKGRQSSQGVVTPLRVYFSLRNGILFARKNYSATKAVAFMLIFPVQSSLFAVARSRNLKSTMASIAMAIIWHLNRQRLPDDPTMVETLRRL